MSASAATDYGVRFEEPVKPVGTVRDTPRWLASLQDELVALIRLPANWDSYGARAIDPQSANMTARFLALVLREDAALPKLVPTPEGNIQLEWYNDRAELEIVVGAQGPLTACFIDHRSGEEWETETTADLATIFGKINACF